MFKGRFNIFHNFHFHVVLSAFRCTFHPVTADSHMRNIIRHHIFGLQHQIPVHCINVVFSHLLYSRKVFTSGQSGCLQNTRSFKEFLGFSCSKCLTAVQNCQMSAELVSLITAVSDQNHIYSERGVYNTTTEQAELLDRSVLTNDGKKLTGDSLFYDRILGYGEAFDNVQMNDTVNRNMLTGDYCFYNELTGSAVATKRAVAIDYSQGDSLFMHGDTLRLITYHMNTDSMYREMRAYHKVRAYRTDVQAVCDSLVYNSKDSCMTMYTDPILWHGEQQLLGEEIKIYMNDSTIDWAHIINQALTVEKKDSIHYNQVSGKEMKAFFIDGDMRLVEVNGNVLVVYYPVEEKDSSLIMMNYSEGGLLKMYLKERRMERGVFVGKTTGTAYPLDQIPPDKSRLPSFVWFDYIRPLNKEDIFEWRAKKAGEVLKKSDRKPVTSPRNMHIKRNNK